MQQYVAQVGGGGAVDPNTVVVDPNADTSDDISLPGEAVFANYEDYELDDDIKSEPPSRPESRFTTPQPVSPPGSPTPRLREDDESMTLSQALTDEEEADEPRPPGTPEQPPKRERACPKSKKKSLQKRRKENTDDDD